MFDILSSATKEGVDVLMGLYRKKIEIKSKSSPADIVTEADIKSQEIIVKSLLAGMLQKGYKEDEIGFITEENFVKPGIHTFIIDPLDGTSNYASGTDRFAISIAYMYKSEILAGIIHAPVTDVIYFAEKGKGAYKIENGKKEKLEIKEKSVEKSLVSINSSSNPKKAIKMFQLAINLTPHVFRVREQGSLTLSLIGVVENKFQAHLNYGTSIWDIAAVKVIMEEAGGVVWDWQGNQFDFDLKKVEKHYSVLAGNPGLLKKLVNYINS